ncbi:unnamed protein product [Schistosoma turkestanicum]|nr:unnamed protein product [Schistosoma turkestanicum]
MRIHWITINLQEQLETRLKESFAVCHLTSIDTNVDCTISKHSIEQLRQIISIYLSIDKLSDLMMLYRKFVLHDQLSQIFIPRPELTHSGSDKEIAAETLNSMYSKALKILDAQLYHVKEQIIRCSPESSEPLSDFDCLVGGFWPETIDLICNNLPEIFSPGHPDRFYSLYTVSMNFIEAVETKTWSTKQLVNLRNHPSYSMFINKWSLPVYFQIRFQEIAANVENTMKKGLIKIEESRNSCLIEVTEVVICQLNRCWEKGIYVDKLMHRFWKLTLQILSRFSSFIDEQIKSAQENKANTSTTTTTTSPTSDSTLPTRSTDYFPELLIYFFVDCFRLVDYVRLELKEQIFTCLKQRLTTQTMNNDDSVNYETTLNECLEQSCERLIKSIDSIMDLIIQKIQQICSNSIRQVLDIPRQYRWTNRDFPSHASSYVSNIINPLMKLNSLGSCLSQSIPNAQPALCTLIQKCVTKVTHDYTVQLSEVSTSVRKMEDSLRRLRNVRHGSSQISNQSQSVNDSGKFHSDDKIRHQLYLDAKAYSDQVKNFWSLDRECTCELDDFMGQIDTTRTEANVCNMNTILTVSQE